MRMSVGKKEVIWSYLGTFMSLVSNLAMLPFIIYFLDGEMLGLWYVFTSIGAIATLFDFGFGVTFARNITYCWSGVSALKKEDVNFADNKEPDFYLMNNVLKTCKIIYLLISIVALLLLSSVGTIYVLYVAKDVKSKSYIIAWAIYAIAIFLNLYYGYYSSFLRGVGAIEQVNQNTVISRSIQICVTIVMLFCGAGLIGACCAYLLYGLIFRVLGKHRFYRYQDIGKHLSDIKTKISKDEMKDLFKTVWHNAWREGVITLCNYLSNQASTLICSLFFTLTETGVYSLGVQIATAISTIAAALYSTYQPQLQAAYVNQDREKIKNTMSTIVVVYIGVFILGLICAIFIGLPILKLIKPETVVGVPILLGLSLYQFILKFRNCYTSYFSCTNRICYIKSFVISAILCVALSFIFTGWFQIGIWGLIVAQIFSQIVYNFWAYALKAHKEMDLNFFSMFGRAKNEIINLIKRK
jgi:O-antigen/teichoic acid export membrane protein